MELNDIRRTILFGKLLEQRFFEYNENKLSLFLTYYRQYPEKTIVVGNNFQLDNVRKLAADWLGKDPEPWRIITRSDYLQFAQCFPCRIESM